MPFKISKPERAELDSFRDRLAKERADLDKECDEQAAIIEAAYEKLNGAIDTYNGVLADARAYIDEIASQAGGDFDDKSERWQEGERGEVTREWIDSLENVTSEMEDVENFTFDVPTLDLPDFSELIDDLEDEPSY